MYPASTMSHERDDRQAQRDNHPVDEAKARLHRALKRLQAAVAVRLEHPAPSAQNELLLQWQQAYETLEEDAQIMQEDNQRLRVDLTSAQTRNRHLQEATQRLSATLDTTISQLETLLKD